MSGVQQLFPPRLARQIASVSASAAAARASVAGGSAPLSAAPRPSHALAGHSRLLHDEHGLVLLRHQAQVYSLLAAGERPAVVGPTLLTLPHDLLIAMVMLPVAMAMVAMVMTLTAMTTAMSVPVYHSLLSDGGARARRIRPGHRWPGALLGNVHALSEKRRSKHFESQREQRRRQSVRTAVMDMGVTYLVGTVPTYAFAVGFLDGAFYMTLPDDGIWQRDMVGETATPDV